MVRIKEVKNDKKQYLSLLLSADEQENMIDRYLDKGTMYVLDDNGVKSECVVMDIGNGILEIKNIRNCYGISGKRVRKSADRLRFGEIQTAFFCFTGRHRDTCR